MASTRPGGCALICFFVSWKSFAPLPVSRCYSFLGGRLLFLRSCLMCLNIHVGSGSGTMSFNRARLGFPAVFEGDFVSVSEMRARLAARRSSPYPTAPVLAPRPASAPLSAHSASEPRRPDPDVPLRPDLAVVRGTRRGGREAAMTASATLEGTALALADLRRDRHAASCKASR